MICESLLIAKPVRLSSDKKTGLGYDRARLTHTDLTWADRVTRKFLTMKKISIDMLKKA